jgi:hypothetical protein
VLRGDGRIGVNAQADRDVAFLAGELVIVRSRGEAGNGDRRVRLLVRRQVVAEAGQFTLGGSHGPEFTRVVPGTIPPQLDHHFQGFESHPSVATAAGVDTEQRVVSGQGANPHAQLVAALGHVVQVSHPMGKFDRVVVGKQGPQGP